MSNAGLYRCVTLLVFLVEQDLFGAFERLPEGGRAAAMGGAAVAMTVDPWALCANPSLAAFIEKRCLSVAYSPRWLGIPELSRS